MDDQGIVAVLALVANLPLVVVIIELAWKLRP